jgi:hypothetical protein
MCGASEEVRNLAKIIADWSAPASDFTFYVSDSDVDLYCKLPLNPTPKSTLWWTKQNCVENFNSLRLALPGPIKWLERHAPLCAQLEQGKVVPREGNVVCIWLPAKPGMTL